INLLSANRLDATLPLNRAFRVIAMRGLGAPLCAPTCLGPSSGRARWRPRMRRLIVFHRLGAFRLILLLGATFVPVPVFGQARVAPTFDRSADSLRSYEQSGREAASS